MISCDDERSSDEGNLRQGYERYRQSLAGKRNYEGSGVRGQGSGIKGTVHKSLSLVPMSKGTECRESVVKTPRDSLLPRLKGEGKQRLTGGWNERMRGEGMLSVIVKEYLCYETTSIWDKKTPCHREVL